MRRSSIVSDGKGPFVGAGMWNELTKPEDSLTVIVSYSYSVAERLQIKSLGMPQVRYVGLRAKTHFAYFSSAIRSSTLEDLDIL